ncbi:hypothetical protein F5884DRAFT_83113 [Xylogone sp. PMI_703]|nr:hypothetical protein F5884DRAFT_83113 [Xylogone sp. PMI_703]
MGIGKARVGISFAHARKDAEASLSSLNAAALRLQLLCGPFGYVLCIYLVQALYVGEERMAAKLLWSNSNGEFITKWIPRCSVCPFATPSPSPSSPYAAAELAQDATVRRGHSTVKLEPRDPVLIPGVFLLVSLGARSCRCYCMRYSSPLAVVEDRAATVSVLKQPRQRHSQAPCLAIAGAR